MTSRPGVSEGACGEALSFLTRRQREKARALESSAEGGAAPEAPGSGGRRVYLPPRISGCALRPSSHLMHSSPCVYVFHHHRDVRILIGIRTDDLPVWEVWRLPVAPPPTFRSILCPDDWRKRGFQQAVPALELFTVNVQAKRF
ncbi:hypothetical protein AOLI_G00189950 [Acnodon oligacanthus]